MRAEDGTTNKIFSATPGGWGLAACGRESGPWTAKGRQGRVSVITLYTGAAILDSDMHARRPYWISECTRVSHIRCQRPYTGSHRPPKTLRCLFLYGGLVQCLVWREAIPIEWKDGMALTMKWRYFLSSTPLPLPYNRRTFASGRIDDGD